MCYILLDDTLTSDELSEANAEIRATESVAARIVREAVAKLHQRADSEWADDWCEYDSYLRFVALLRSATGYVGADGNPVVRVTGPDAELWGYVASEALDSAVSELPDMDLVIDEMRPGVYRTVHVRIIYHAFDVWRIEYHGRNMIGYPVTDKRHGQSRDFKSLGEALQFMGF